MTTKNWLLQTPQNLPLSQNFSHGMYLSIKFISPWSFYICSFYRRFWHGFLTLKSHLPKRSSQATLFEITSSFLISIILSFLFSLLQPPEIILFAYILSFVFSTYSRPLRAGIFLSCSFLYPQYLGQCWLHIYLLNEYLNGLAFYMAIHAAYLAYVALGLKWVIVPDGYTCWGGPKKVALAEVTAGYRKRARKGWIISGKR